MYDPNFYQGVKSFATADFTGAAKIYLPIQDYDTLQILMMMEPPPPIDRDLIYRTVREDYVDLDLVITDVSYTHADRAQIMAYVGDSMGSYFFGKQAVVIRVSARLFETQENDARHTLMTLYRDLFRASAVASYGVTPHLECIGMDVRGVFLNLNIADEALIGDGANVTFNFLVLGMQQSSPENINAYAQNWGIEYDRQTADMEDLAAYYDAYDGYTPGTGESTA